MNFVVLNFSVIQVCVPVCPLAVIANPLSTAILSPTLAEVVKMSYEIIFLFFLKFYLLLTYQ